MIPDRFDHRGQLVRSCPLHSAQSPLLSLSVRLSALPVLSCVTSKGTVLHFTWHQSYEAVLSTKYTSVTGGEVTLNTLAYKE